jgi:hypothetical protein
VARHLHWTFKSRSDSFRRLQSVIRSFEGKSEQARRLSGTITTFSPWFDGLFGEIDRPNALRDVVAHKNAAIERVETCFSVFHLGERKALLFDCELEVPALGRSVPIFATAAESVKWLSYFVLGSVAACTSTPPLSPDECDSVWKPVTLPLSLFLDEGGTDAVTVARRMTLDGFELSTRKVGRTLRQSAIDLPRRSRRTA